MSLYEFVYANEFVVVLSVPHPTVINPFGRFHLILWGDKDKEQTGMNDL